MSATAQIIRATFPAPIGIRGGKATSVTKDAHAQSEDPLAKLDQVAMAVTVSADEELFDQDSPVRHCFRLVRGCLRTVRLMEDGRRLIDRFLLPGDLIGFDGGTHHDVAAQAVVATVLHRYPLQAVTLMAERDADFARFLWRTAAAELRRAHGHGLLLGRMTATERVANFLCDMATRRTRQECDGVACPPLHLPMGRADIADHLGLTVETISRTLTQLRRAGVITVQPGTIGIRNIAALAKLGDGTGTDAISLTAWPSNAADPRDEPRGKIFQYPN